MVGHGDIHHLQWLDAALIYELVYELAVMKHLKIAAQLWIFIFHGVEAMGAGSNDLTHIVAVHGVDILLSQYLE